MEENNEKYTHKRKHRRHCGPSDAIYGFGFIGAAVYFIQHSSSFGEGLVGFIKAIGWPAVVLYRVLEILGL